jgi:hypothetical protein
MDGRREAISCRYFIKRAILYRGMIHGYRMTRRTFPYYVHVVVATIDTAIKMIVIVCRVLRKDGFAVYLIISFGLVIQHHSAILLFCI